MSMQTETVNDPRSQGITCIYRLSFSIFQRRLPPHLLQRLQMPASVAEDLLGERTAGGIVLQGEDGVLDRGDILLLIED